MKLPISELMCSQSAIVPHDRPANLALDSASAKDLGLRANGVTIEMMQDCPELSLKMDDLDRAGVAIKESKRLSSDVKKVVSKFKVAQTDRNKPKNVL